MKDRFFVASKKAILEEGNKEAQFHQKWQTIPNIALLAASILIE